MNSARTYSAIFVLLYMYYLNSVSSAIMYQQVYVHWNVILHGSGQTRAISLFIERSCDAN